MTLLFSVLAVTMLGAIVLTRRSRNRWLRIFRVLVLYPLLLLSSFVLFARWQLRSARRPPDPVAMAEGRQLFENTCTGCHSLDRGRGRGPSLRNVADKYDPDILALWMMNSEAVYQEYGKRPLTPSYPPMPKLELDKPDADAIAAYLVSLSQQEE